MSTKYMKLGSWLIALTMAGCSVKEAPPIIHQKPVQETVSNPGDADKQSQFKALDLTKFQAKASNVTDDLLTSTIQPLAALVLSPAVYNSYETYQFKYFEALISLNDAIVLEYRRDPDALLKSKVMDTYKKTVLVDCNMNLQGQCPNVAIFNKEGHFAQIMVILAKNETNVLEFYRDLKLALDVSTSTTNQELSFLYLSRANELAKFYGANVDKNGQSTLDAASVDALRLHANMTQQLLQTFDPAKVSNKQLDQLMTVFNPFDQSRKNPNVLNYGLDRLLELAAKGYVYCDDNQAGGCATLDRPNGRLNPDFKAKVVKILNNSDAYYGVGLSYIHDHNIGQSTSKQILSNLGLNEPIEANEYMYLVDRIYYSHFNTDDAVAFWNFTKKDRNALFKAINQFVRLQIANKIVWTNDQTNAFFNDNVSPDGKPRYGDIMALLEQAIANSLKLHAEWDRTLIQVNNLMNFVDHEYGSTNLLSLPADDPYHALTDSIAGLQQNIKMLSVYPNMMMFVYLMAKENFSATFQGWFGAITITPDEVIQDFFVNVMSPWFSYGTDGQSLTQVELLYALHFTLETETFSAFKNNPLLAVDAASFLREITDKLTNTYIQSMKDHVSAVSDTLHSNGRLMDDAIAACNIEKDLQAKEAGLPELLPRPYIRNIQYDDLDSQLANGYGARTSGNPTWSLGVFFSAGKTTNMSTDLNQMRFDIADRIFMLENMKGIIVSYLDETHGDSSAVKTAYDDQISKLTDLRAQYLLAIYQTINRIGDCDFVLYKHEVEMRNAIYRHESEYLKSVYKNLTDLNALAKTDKAAATAKMDALNKALSDLHQSDVDLPADYKVAGGFDHYRPGSAGFYYEYYKFDAKLRVRADLEKMSQGATKVTLPNLNQTTMDEYIKHPAHQMLSWKATGEMTEDDFLTDGMSQFITDLGAEDYVEPTYFIEKIADLAQLYRMGPIDASTGDFGCTQNCLEIKPEFLIDQTFKILKLADISDYDQQVLKWTHGLIQSQKFKDSFWVEFAIENGTRRPLGLLDITFQRITGEGDSTAASISSKVLDRTITFYDTEQSVGNFLFLPRKEIKELIDGNYAHDVQDYEARTQAFLDAYQKVQLIDPYKVSKVRYTTNTDIVVPTEIVDGKTVPQYLSTARLQRYTSTINNFHSRTNHAFQKK